MARIIRRRQHNRAVISLPRPFTEAGDVRKDSLGLRFPADTTSTPRSNGLGIIYNTERAANELCSEIDRRTPQEGERNSVYDDTGPSHNRMLELTADVSQFWEAERL